MDRHQHAGCQQRKTGHLSFMPLLQEQKGSQQQAEECIEDIDGAISFLSKKGYKEFYLIGHSTGANKICVYNFYKTRNRIKKYVLVAGGDDTGIYYDMLGMKKFSRLLKEAKTKIKQRKGDEIIKEL